MHHFIRGSNILLLKFIQAINAVFWEEYTPMDSSIKAKERVDLFTFNQIKGLSIIVKIGIITTTYIFNLLCICFKGKLFYNCALETQKTLIQWVQKHPYEPFQSMVKFYASVFLLYIHFKTYP